MKVGFCGSGAWGITLANIIAGNGHIVLLWSIEKDVIQSLSDGLGHPRFPDYAVDPSIQYTTNLSDLLDCDVIVECVTASGLRPVCNELKRLGGITQPFIVTSKGIEQNTSLLLVEVAEEILGNPHLIGYMGGPTLAKEVMLKHPTSAMGASTNFEVRQIIKDLFAAPSFQIYESADITGVALCGAVKNVIAIATGISDGLGYGYNTKAHLITMGLQEMVELAKAKGGQEASCIGLAGLGDLIVTGISDLSRNFRFGKLLGQGNNKDEALKKIAMVVEGTYSVLSAHQIACDNDLHLPIVSAMYQVIYEGKDARDALEDLLSGLVFSTT